MTLANSPCEVNLGSNPSPTYCKQNKTKQNKNHEFTMHDSRSAKIKDEKGEL